MVYASVLGSLLLLAGLLHHVDPLWQYQFHILLLGGPNVDKPSLLRHYVEGIFVEGVAQAVAVDFSVPFMEAEPGGPAGQERSPPTPEGASPPIRKRRGVGGHDKDELWTKSTGLSPGLPCDHGQAT